MPQDSLPQPRWLIRWRAGLGSGYDWEYMSELPDDYWHTFVYVHFGWLCCGQCQIEPDLQWAWQGIDAKGETGIQVFTTKAVEHLKSAGWIMYANEPCCPSCAAKLGVGETTRQS